MASGAIGLSFDQPSTFFRTLHNYPISCSTRRGVRAVTRARVNISAEHGIENHVSINDSETVVFIPSITNAR